MSSSKGPSPTSTTSYGIPLMMVTSLFFFWGFVHNLDPILIPHLRKAFSLTFLQSALVDSAVYVAYFGMALPAGLIMRRFGYRIGIVVGLILFGVGSLLFLPAADTMAYGYFLGALFVIASGLAILETAANPYVTILGPSETAVRRLNFAQSFNGLAVVLAPLVGGQFILTNSSELIDASAEAATVKLPYMVLGLIILVVAVLFLIVRLPEIQEKDDSPGQGTNVLRHSHLRWAVAAQFMYVGAQVCVTSFFINVAVTQAGLTEKEAAVYLGLGYGMAFMSGRFVGTFIMRFIKPHLLLLIYAVICLFLSILSVYFQGMLVVFSLIGLGFFMSIMFPTIFSLGISGLGNETKIASSLIIMAIVGGALLPPLMGYISDQTNSIQMGYCVPLVCYAFIAFYAWQKWKPVATSDQ